MQTADSHQVGGAHYKGTDYEHWTLVLDVGMDYFSGCATKYVCRWRKKNEPVTDLQKALHFLNKLEENWIRETTIQGRPSVPVIQEDVRRFSELNKLTDLERAFVEGMCTWRNGQDLAAAREVLFLLMDAAEAKLLDEGAAPVPLTEENHYSERANQGGA